MKRKTSGTPPKARHGPLWRIAERIQVLQDRFRPRDRSRRDPRLAVLQSIYGEAKAERVYREYMIRKKEKLLAVFLAGMGLSALLALDSRSHRDDTVSALQRPESGAGSALYEMDVTAGGEDLGTIRLQIPAQKLSADSQRALLDAAAEELDAWMNRKGWQADAVDRSISFPETLQDGLVEVRFESSRYDILDGSGSVYNDLLPEEGELVELSAVLTCGAEQQILTYPVRVVPAGQDMLSRLYRETGRRLLEAESQPETEAFPLPDTFDQKALSWKPVRPSYGPLIAFLTLAGCAALSAAFDRDLSRKGEERRETLALEYPSFLLRLALLAGTGMPLRMVFAKLAREAEGEDALPVYEEVLRTVREMESGIGELTAYENFGTRCGLPQYKKCASLLAQNVRKGTGGLLQALRQEAVQAFEDRKAYARKRGEEAQTRLLIPMLMMLVVVMILVMVPACFSFGGI